MPCHATMCAPKLLQLFLMADGWSKATITKKGAPPPVGNPPKSCWMAAGGCWQDATCAICFTDSCKRAKDCFRAIGISQKSCEGHKYLRLSPLLQPYISPESWKRHPSSRPREKSRNSEVNAQREFSPEKEKKHAKRRLSWKIFSK